MPLPADQLDGFLQSIKQGNPQDFVALHADEEVPYGKIVEILDKGSKNGLKIVLATKPAQAPGEGGRQAQQPSAAQQ